MSAAAQAAVEHQQERALPGQEMSAGVSVAVLEGCMEEEPESQVHYPPLQPEAHRQSPSARQPPTVASEQREEQQRPAKADQRPLELDLLVDRQQVVLLILMAFRQQVDRRILEGVAKRPSPPECGRPADLHRWLLAMD